MLRIAATGTGSRQLVFTLTPGTATLHNPNSLDRSPQLLPTVDREAHTLRARAFGFTGLPRVEPLDRKNSAKPRSNWQSKDKESRIMFTTLRTLPLGFSS